jgi:hypothetical protein
LPSSLPAASPACSSSPRAGVEVLAGAGREQPSQRIIGQDRDQLLGDGRRLHLGHQVGRDLDLTLQPGVERLARAVAVGGGRWLPAGEQVGQERLNVCPAGLGQPTAPAGEEGLQEPDGLQVGIDRAVGPVLGPEMALEGAGQVG